MSRTKTASSDRVHLRRMYMDSRYGQLHLLTAFPSSGGFDERTAVICVPGQDGSSADFRDFASSLGRDRSVYALDPPGRGNSDGPAGPASAADLAATVADVLDQLRLRSVDIVAVGLGAQGACELACKRAEVHRLVLLGASGPGVRPEQPLLEVAGTDAAANLIAIRDFLDRD